jgi:hypothetical protein
MVVVLLSMVAQGSSYGSNGGCQVSGEGFGGLKKSKREEKGSASSRNKGERLFFVNFGPNSLHSWTMKIKYIYRR